MWKHLEHQNIVPIVGITSTPLQLISEWMPGGDLTEYIKEYPDVDRLDLVGAPPAVFGPTLTLTISYVISPGAFTFSTPAMWFTVISRECVMVPNPVSPLY